MEVIKQGGVEVDRCYSCKGIWFDEFELETLKKQSTSNQKGEKSASAELPPGTREI